MNVRDCMPRTDVLEPSKKLSKQAVMELWFFNDNFCLKGKSAKLIINC